MPTSSTFELALPALQVNVTLDPLNVDPGTGVSITDAPFGVGVGVDVGVAVGVAVGVGVGVGVPLGPLVQVGNLNEPTRVIQLRPAEA